MLPRSRLLVVGVVTGFVVSLVVAALALLGSASPAAAGAPAGCTASSAEDKTVRIFPRVGTTPGPAGTSSELQCGNHFYGLRRIETEWTGIPEWRSTADAAIARALTSGRAPVYDRRSDTWTYRAPDVIVVLRPRGLILDALPAVPEPSRESPASG